MQRYLGLLKFVSMKATILICGLFLTTVTTTNATPAPVNNSAAKFSVVFNGFDAFHAHRQQAGIALAWTHVSGNVTGYVIQHSYDGVSFNTIDQVAPDASGRNNYKDNGAFPGFNYYRIGALLSDGSTDWSDVKEVRIVRRK
jgi:hypothetical protein